MVSTSALYTRTRTAHTISTIKARNTKCRFKAIQQQSYLPALLSVGKKDKKLDMASLDTLKFDIPGTAINLNLDAMTKTTKEAKDKEPFIRYESITPTPGISGITYTPLTDKIVITTSAKVLGKDYRQGISYDTWQQYTDTLNTTGIVKADPDQLFQEAHVHRVDPCCTIELSQRPKEAIKALRLLNMFSRYSFDPYIAGMVVTRKAKSRNDRAVIYGKLDELLRSENEAFREAHPEALGTFTENSLRLEHQLRKLKDIRTAFDIEQKEARKLPLSAVLLSDKNPVLDMFTRISADHNKALTRIRSMATNTKELEAMALLQLHNWNLDAVMASVENCTSGKLSYYRKKYRTLIAKNRAIEAKRAGIDGLIPEIQDKLLEAS